MKIFNQHANPHRQVGRSQKRHRTSQSRSIETRAVIATKRLLDPHSTSNKYLISHMLLYTPALKLALEFELLLYFCSHFTIDSFL